MKIAQINMVEYGSTGRIMLQISECARKNGNQVITFSKKWRNQRKNIPDHTYFGYFLENACHLLFANIFSFNGSFSHLGTRQLLRKIEKFQPYIIHLHNLHNYCVNLPMLFNYIKKHKVPVVWTLHDCWAFTGQCPCFTMVKCEKWKDGCHHCMQIHSYPSSLLDMTKPMWYLKKKWFTGVNKMIIVTPSDWLANLVKESFLKDYPVHVINNGINLGVFKPTTSSFREKHGIKDDQYLILGVAYSWGKRKGLDVFIELSKRLSREYQIVLVGTDDTIDKQLPEHIITIHRTRSQVELAEIYTAADLFVNPTREDNYPTVNMESLACGTPVLTFNTGGCSEILDETCGSVVECDDIDGMIREIIRICNEKPFSIDACLKRSKRFDMNDRFSEYLHLYDEL